MGLADVDQPGRARCRVSIFRGGLILAGPYHRLALVAPQTIGDRNQRTKPNSACFSFFRFERAIDDNR